MHLGAAGTRALFLALDHVGDQLDHLLDAGDLGVTVLKRGAPVTNVSLGSQVVWLFIMAIPIACVAWTVTHEEVFREPREYCETRVESARSIFARKFFYLFTCEYCFSHYVTAVFLIITRYKLLYNDWRGYLLAFFAFPFLSNLYMGIYAQTKLGVKKE
ncbi:MAG: hypothetical protein ACXVUX_21290, partial [Solirubrobacteraceae bacterium]